MEVSPTARGIPDRRSDTWHNDDFPLIIIQGPGSTWDLRWRELWQYRELVYFLTWRDIKVRYKQTILGPLWFILHPLITTIVFTVIFGSEKRSYRETGGDAELWKALARVNKAAQKENGPISYLRGFTYCERDRIHILKPATMRNWCCTAALNDADAIFEHLAAKSA